MKLRTNATLFVLRTTARLAWALVNLSRGLHAISERLEGAVDRMALRRGLDVAEALHPLGTERSAD
jgi:hypothetical protein